MRAFTVCSATRRWLTLSFLGLFTAAAWAADFPLNGGFELGSGQPLGWQLRGAWEVKTQAARYGKAGLQLPLPAPGDQIVSAGYLLSDPGQVLRLRLAYLAPGGLRVGLLPCDALGRPRCSAVLKDLPAATTWQVADEELSLAPDAVPAETAAVRLVIMVGPGSGAVKLDDLSLAPVTPVRPLTSPALPKVDPLKLPNLAPPLDGRTTNWNPVGVAGMSPLQTGTRPGSAAGTVALTLTGGEAGCGFLSRTVTVDGGLPYRWQTTVTGQGWDCGQVTLLARLRSPRDPSIVLYQAEQAIPVTRGLGVATVSLPRLGDKVPAHSQAAVLLDPASQGTVSVLSARLEPEAVTITARPQANLKPGPENVSLFVTAINNAAVVIKPTALLTTLDPAGRTIHTEKRLLGIGSRSASYFPYKPKLPAAGDYDLAVRVVLGTQTLGSGRFAFHAKQPETLGGFETTGGRRQTRGYVSVGATDTLKLSLLYKGPGREAGAGLELCDTFGRPVGEAVTVNLPAAANWTPVTQEFKLADVVGFGAFIGSVRPFTRESQGDEDFDAVVVTNLTTPARPVEGVSCPTVRLTALPDLLPEPDPWTVASWPGLDSTQARVTDDTVTGERFHNLYGSAQGAAWTSGVIPLDGSLPYVFSATTSAVNLRAGQGLLVLRLVDPADPAAVLWQTSAVVEACRPTEETRLSVPRQSPKPGLALLQAAVYLEANSDGCMGFRDAHLRPELLTVNLRRGVVGAGAARALLPQIFVSAVNNGTTDLRPNAELNVRDSAGQIIYSEKRAIVIGARSAAYFPFVVRLPAPGAYRASVAIVSAGRELGRGNMVLTAP